MGVQIRAVHPLQSGKAVESLGSRLRTRRNHPLVVRATSESDASATQHTRLHLRAIATVALSSTSLLALKASAAAAATTATHVPEESMVIPALLSVMLGGAVYGALTDPTLKRLAVTAGAG